MKTNKIHLLDSIPGSGKTTAVINYLNDNPDAKILYIADYLSEVERICDATHCVQPHSFFCENLEDYWTKKNDIKKLIFEGRSIASTHSLFVAFDDEILELINHHQYHIIMDEVVSPITEITSTYNQADYNTLSKEGFIKVGDKGRIAWNWDIEPDSAYDKLKELCDTGQLFKAGGYNKFLHILPPNIFSAAGKVTVMTYNFPGSHLYAYLLSHGFTIVKEDELKVDDTSKLKQHIKDNLVILNHRKTDKERTKTKKSYKTNGYTLSYSCYNREIFGKKHDFIKYISAKINVISRMVINNYDDSLRLGDVMYTFPQAFSGIVKDKIYGKNEIKVKKIYKKTSRTIRPVNISPLQCFVPLNCRGTNIYGDKAILVYCYNQHCSPNIKNYYETYTNVEIDEDALALNALVQWVFRSRIRNYVPGEKVYIYCLSERMEKLLTEWVYSL